MEMMYTIVVAVADPGHRRWMHKIVVGGGADHGDR